MMISIVMMEIVVAMHTTIIKTIVRTILSLLLLVTRVTPTRRRKRNRKKRGGGVSEFLDFKVLSAAESHLRTREEEEEEDHDHEDIATCTQSFALLQERQDTLWHTGRQRLSHAVQSSCATVG